MQNLFCCLIEVIYLGSVIRGLLLTWRGAECRQNKNASKSKVTVCTHFYWKWKPLVMFVYFWL